MVYSLRLKLQILSALSVLLLDKPLLFVTSHLFEEGKKKVCSTFLLVEMNYHVVSSTNSFSHTFLPICLPPHMGHKCLPPVTLIETPWFWDKFLLFHMLLLWFGLFLWVCKDENSLHRACKPSNEKGETQRKNIFRKREEEKIIIVQLQMPLCLTWAAGQFWSWGLWKKPWVSGCIRTLNSQLGHPGCPKVGSGACPSLPCPLSLAWHASPAGVGEGVCTSTGMVASGMHVVSLVSK